MKVPFFDLKRQYEQLKPEIWQAMNRVMDQTAFSGGPFVSQLETELAAFNETGFAVGVNNGTNAIQLALLALGIGPGDEVIVPANTFIATAWGVSYVGATPVFADCDPMTWNLDPVDAERKISPKTKAIIGVHLYGQPFNIDALSRLCNEKGIHLMEDNAQAMGATYKGRKVGQFGVLSTTSFYPGKNLGAYGEGGAVFGHDPALGETIQMLKNHGSRERYYHEALGFNMRMEGLQAAVLSVKLPHLPAWNQRRQFIAKAYRQLNHPRLQFQAPETHAESVYHLAVVIPDDKQAFLTHLENEGVGYAFHYPVPCHLQKAYAHLGYQKGDFPHAEHLAENCVSLPMFPEMSDAELERVLEILKNF
ncbi:MAG: DegT/DnrJ/EryC1/StrS family aminotransferase [Bacteroidia bacterium]